MRKVILDGKLMTTKSDMHDCLMARFELPYYYSRSLDSLWGILLKETDPVEITVCNRADIAIGYGEALVSLLRDLEESNPNYTIHIEE